MNRWILRLSIALTGIVLTSVPVSAATLEYTFTVPYKLNAGPADTPGGAPRAMSISCAVGPVALSYSTATGAATGATGSGTTQNVRSNPATVVVTVDAETRGDKIGGASKAGAGGALQPTQAGGYYTCWATFAGGQTPVNFLPTTALPKVPLK